MAAPVVTLRLASIVGVVCLAACGGGLDRHAAYRDIQIEEARLAHALHGIEGLAPDDAAARCDVACDASDAIARQADALAHDGEGGVDADAATRARNAARACAGCRAP